MKKLFIVLVVVALLSGTANACVESGTGNDPPPISWVEWQYWNILEWLGMVHSC